MRGACEQGVMWLVYRFRHCQGSVKLTSYFHDIYIARDPHMAAVRIAHA